MYYVTRRPEKPAIIEHFASIEGAREFAAGYVALHGNSVDIESGAGATVETVPGNLCTTHHYEDCPACAPSV